MSIEPEEDALQRRPAGLTGRAEAGLIDSADPDLLPPAIICPPISILGCSALVPLVANSLHRNRSAHADCPPLRRRRPDGRAWSRPRTTRIRHPRPASKIRQGAEGETCCVGESSVIVMAATVCGRAFRRGGRRLSDCLRLMPSWSSPIAIGHDQSAIRQLAHRWSLCRFRWLRAERRIRMILRGRDERR